MLRSLLLLAVLTPSWLQTATASPVPGPVTAPVSSWDRRSFTFNPNPALFDSNDAHAQIERRDWSLSQPGTTGVAAMQIVVVSETQVLIIDKVQHNPLTVNGHTAWSSIYSITNNTVRPVDLQSNTFCASGNFLSNGTLVSIGGNISATNPPPIPNVGGMQGFRLFNPDECNDSDSQCAFYEDPERLLLASDRWYPSSVRLQDGSILIVGGTDLLTWINDDTIDNPTMEFYPPKSLHGYNGVPIPSQFLLDTLDANLFPILFLLSDGNIFVAANTKAMIYDWQNNIETRLPDIPNGVRVSYPMTGSAVLLPLRPSSNYESTVMICGGQTADDKMTQDSYSALDPASSQCASITLTPSGIAQGWMVEAMPEARVMPDVVMLPTGQTLIVNGAQTGYAAYGTARDQVGQSNADHPVFTPVLYDPSVALDSGNLAARFSKTGLPTSDIPRLYHSVATLLPTGEIFIAGSAPNEDVSNVTYITDYRAEILKPDYVDDMSRPTIIDSPAQMDYDSTYTVLLQSAPAVSSTVEVALMNFGFSTHSVHMDMRHVELVAVNLPETGTLEVSSPPNSNIYPPGPGWLIVLVNGVPSAAKPVMIGNGEGPPVDEAAIANMLLKTKYQE